MESTGRSSSRSGLGIVRTLAMAAVSRRLGVRGELAACLGLEAFVVALGIGGPLALKVLVDGLSDDIHSPLWAGVLIVAFIGSWLGGSVVGAWRQVFSQRIIDRLNAEIVDDALKTCMPALATGAGSDTGRTLGLIERLPFSLQVIIEGLIWQLAPTVLQVTISLLIIAGLLEPLYVLVLGATLVGFAVSTWYGAVRQHTVSLDANAAAGQLSGTVGDVLRNARRVVLNGALLAERNLIRGRFTERRRAFGRMLRSQAMTGLFQYGVAGMGLTVLLTLGASDALAGHMSVGDFILLQAYAFRLVLPLSGFGFVISQAAIALITVRDILDLSKAEEDEGLIVNVPEGAAAIRLNDVSFSYGLGLQVLRDVSVDIPPGTFCVIVGPNGSGKSTLAQLMAGVLDPGAGEVHVAGVPLQTVPCAQRHRLLLYVPQTVALLNRSLLANALYPPTGQTEAELMRLLTEWRFYDPAREIDFNATVGEQGERLSGGQVQKLELARIARVKVPAIVLDESTSALDPVSEAEIIRSLREGYGEGTTVVMITHRKRLAEMADMVLFMKNGTLLRAGKHETLMRESASYAKLWQGHGRE